MEIGDKVTVKYRINERTTETRHGTVEYISPFGWVTIRFAAGYAEGFWRGEVIECK